MKTVLNYDDNTRKITITLAFFEELLQYKDKLDKLKCFVDHQIGNNQIRDLYERFYHVDNHEEALFERVSTLEDIICKLADKFGIKQDLTKEQ